MYDGYLKTFEYFIGHSRPLLSKFKETIPRVSLGGQGDPQDLQRLGRIKVSQRSPLCQLSAHRETIAVSVSTKSGPVSAGNTC